MIISNNRKFIFLKNPRTGSTSVQKFFLTVFRDNTRPTSGADLTYFDHYGRTTTRITEQCMPLQHYIDNNFVTGDISQYTTYVVVRDPIERFRSVCRSYIDTGKLVMLYSQDFWKIMTDEEKETALSCPKTLTLDPAIFSSEFIDLYNSISIDQIANKLLTNPSKINPNHYGLPQSVYYEDFRVKVIDYKNLQQEVDNICDIYGFTKSTLPEIHRSVTTSSFTEETINSIKNVYSKDVEYYSRLSQ